MARTKREYGSGCLLETRKGWAIRWRELEIAPDGKKRRVVRYKTLGVMSRKQAAMLLAQQVVKVGSQQCPARSRIEFRMHVDAWNSSMLPMYKASTQKNHRHNVVKHLMPQFGSKELSAITRQDIQAYVAHLKAVGYAPRSIDHIHDTLSAILRTAVTWGHLADNPTRGVVLPRLVDVRPRFALTVPQAASLLSVLPPLPRTMAGLAILSGLRRGELFALRWKDIDEHDRSLTVREAVYEGTFSSPKTTAGLRKVALPDGAVKLLTDWKSQAKSTDQDALVFATRFGHPISPQNVLNHWIFPACKQLGLPKSAWLTFRRTYSTWLHQNGTPGKVVAQLMGHAKVDTTLNLYTQVVDGAARAAVEHVGDPLFSIVQFLEGSNGSIH
jgi:integrase